MKNSKISMLKHLLIFIVSLLSIKSFSQKNNTEALKLNNIIKVNGYLLETKTSTDTILISKEYYNKSGIISKLEIFDSLEHIINTYKYIYRFDTLRTAFLVYNKGKLKVKTIYIYDKKNVKSSTTVYLNNQHESYTTYIFNKEGRIVELKEFKNNKINFLTEFKYYSFGEIRQKIVKYPRHLRSLTRYRKTRADIEQFSKTENIFENYKNSNKKLINTLIVFNRKSSFPTDKGKMSFEKRDELKTKSFYLENGLIDYILQYKNDVLIAKKIFSYQ